MLLQVTKMKMISPSNREVDVGRTLSETEYIGMCRCEGTTSWVQTALLCESHVGFASFPPAPCQRYTAEPASWPASCIGRAGLLG